MRSGWGATCGAGRSGLGFSGSRLDAPKTNSAILVRAHDVVGAVRRSVGDDHPLDPVFRVVQGQQPVHGVANLRGLVVGGHRNRHGRPRLGVGKGFGRPPPPTYHRQNQRVPEKGVEREKHSEPDQHPPRAPEDSVHGHTRGRTTPHEGRPKKRATRSDLKAKATIRLRAIRVPRGRGPRSIVPGGPDPRQKHGSGWGV